MTVLVLQAENSISSTIHLVYFTPVSFILGIIGLYVINVLFGLIPINSLLRKTPAEIMKKYDL